MKFIGLTGGVGAGKTTVLKAMKQMYRVRILIADEIAHEQMEPGTACYEQLKEAFGDCDFWTEDGRIDRSRLAQQLFSNEEQRRVLNGIVHPAVKEYILAEVERERRRETYDYVILEAALLIEDHYDRICDELWYVYASEQTRMQRLMSDRGYSRQKVEDIFAAQLSDETYRKYCSVVIDNDRDAQYVLTQIKQLYKSEEKQDGHTQRGQ